jgi:hypothetical protein
VIAIRGRYAQLQSTKPQTLAYALNDSPGRSGGLVAGEVPLLAGELHSFFATVEQSR